MFQLVMPVTTQRDSGRRSYVKAIAFCLTFLGTSISHADVTVLLAQGDSLTQGTMNATDDAINTVNAYLQHVADSLRQVTPLVFRQPLLDEMGERIDPSVFATNLAVDGADIFSVEGLQYYKRVGADESYFDTGYFADKPSAAELTDDTDRVLFPINRAARKPVSQVSAAQWWLGRIAAAPQAQGLLIVWAGNNDASTAALGTGGDNPAIAPIPLDQIGPEITPALRLLLRTGEALGLLSLEPYTQANIERNLTAAEDFEPQYQRVLNRVLGSAGANKLDSFLMTLPYYTGIGYLMDADDLEFYLRKLESAYQVPASFQRSGGSGVVDGDRVSLLTFGFMYALLDSGYDTGYVNGILEQGGIQRDGMVLSEAEQAFIVARIDAFNAVIRAEATSRGPRVHLVDVGQTLNDLLAGEMPLTVDGLTFDRRWGRGNSYSLDGVHPGHTVHALIANEVIDGIDTALGLAAPPVSLDNVAISDPYLDRDGDGWVPGPQSVSPGIGEVLALFRDPDDTDPEVQAVLPGDVWQQISGALIDSLTQSASVRAEAVRLGVIQRD